MRAWWSKLAGLFGRDRRGSIYQPSNWARPRRTTRRKISSSGRQATRQRWRRPSEKSSTAWTPLGIAGVAIAAPLAYVTARGMTALLFGVEPGDPLTYMTAAALALVMTLAGTVRPAVRAATIDPALTIRNE